MTKFILILISLIPNNIIATPQASEKLIYKQDTIWMDYFPLEKLRFQESDINIKLKDIFPWVSTGNWRGYIGTWKIENDSLFLVELISDKTGMIVCLDRIFEKSKIINNRLFASWYNERIITDYGIFLGYDPISFEKIYTGDISFKVNQGIVSDLYIVYKTGLEIEAITKRLQEARDTMICLIAEEEPIFITPERNYKINELNEFISISNRNSEILNNCTERIILSLLIEKDGTLSRVEVIRPSTESNCTVEAVKIAKTMKYWIPGKIKNKPVRMKIIYRFL